jgi:hypothetical protein
VTPEQYERGWELISTAHTMGQILAATGLTRPQLDYLTRQGHPRLNKPSYVSQLAEISQQVRKRAAEAAEAVGVGALAALKAEIDLHKLATGLASQLIHAHIQYRALPAQQRLRAGGLGADEQAEQVSQMAMDKATVESLRALRQFTSLEPTARMFRTVFDGPAGLADATGGAQVAKLDLSPAQALPASYALVEDLVDQADPAALDPLDLVPEWAGWTLEEIDHYHATGELPHHAYGDVRDVADLPDECLDQSPEDP